MAEWNVPQISQKCLYQPDALPAAGASVGGTVNISQGAWSTLVASLPYDVEHMVLRIFPTSGGTGYQVIDIGIGPVGEEITLVPGYFFTQSQNAPTMDIPIPMYIPKGTRVAITNGGGPFFSASWQYELSMLQAAPFMSNRNVRAMAFGYGGSTINMIRFGGPWSQYNDFGPATVWPIREVIACFSSSSAVSPGATFRIDVGVVPDGTNLLAAVPIIRGIILIGKNANFGRYIYGPYPVDIPAGWRFRSGGLTPNGFPAGSPAMTLIGFG